MTHPIKSRRRPYLRARWLLRKGWREFSDAERRVVRHVARGTHVSRDTSREFDERMTLGQRVADRVAAFGGSWTFILLFCSFLLAWIVLNSWLVLRRQAFDPYPFILLNLILSTLAAFQAPVILMSQNRQAAKDRLDAAHDYEVNLKAELEILALHEKLDDLRERRWMELVEMQDVQIKLLTRLLAERASPPEQAPPGPLDEQAPGGD